MSKAKLTEQGVIVFPEYQGRDYAVSTWNKKGVKSEFLEIEPESEPVRDNTYFFDPETMPLTEYGTKFHGDTVTLDVWYKRLGFKFTNAAIAAGILIKK